jgi:F-box and WD-40 domain protein 1/11
MREDPPPLPNGPIPGAGARAAAAAQNEILRTLSNAEAPVFHEDNLDVKPSLDSESGIEINIESPSDMSIEESEFVRKGEIGYRALFGLFLSLTIRFIDPVQALPGELMAQVLAFLDSDSLKNAELVSRNWHAQASSRHVWREVFRREYRRRPGSSQGIYGKPRSMGMGKTRPNQDWKKMLGVRRTLEKRWKEGKAAAIYLHGHKDTVYCVQFDE